MDGETTATEAGANLLVRVWLPDRPGALGLVASRIGAVRGDIVGVDILERSEHVAVDEFAVTLHSVDLIPSLIREIEEVDGASVEEVRMVGSFPDPRIDALESAAQLCDAVSIEALKLLLVEHTRAEFLTDWAALVAAGSPDVIIDGDGAPNTEGIIALAAGAAASPLVANGSAGPNDLAVALLESQNTTLLLGRAGHPFRRRERLQLRVLARIADRAWTLLDQKNQSSTTS